MCRRRAAGSRHRPAGPVLLDDDCAMPAEGGQFRRTLARWPRADRDKVIRFCHDGSRRYVYSLKSIFERRGQCAVKTGPNQHFHGARMREWVVAVKHRAGGALRVIGKSLVRFWMVARCCFRVHRCRLSRIVCRQVPLRAVGTKSSALACIAHKSLGICEQCRLMTSLPDL